VSESIPIIQGPFGRLVGTISTHREQAHSVQHIIAPWAAPLTDAERSLIEYGVVVAGLALLAMLIRTWLVRSEVSGRYRPAVAASMGVLAVAFLSYVAVAVAITTGYTRVGDVWVPGDHAVWAWSVRYMEWAISVPLLVVELMAVSTLRGRTLSRIRSIGVGAAFLMITAGYMGGIVVGGGEDRSALLLWGVISAVFFGLLYTVVLYTVLHSLPALPSLARPTYRNAMVLLMVTWFVYPIVFGLQGWTEGGGWAVVGQLVLCAADVVAKVGFGVQIHRVAKLRTAFDVDAGLDTHPESLWIDGERHPGMRIPVTLDPSASDVPAR
jgi:bacteriorhodopsin